MPVYQSNTISHAVKVGYNSGNSGNSTIGFTFSDYPPSNETITGVEILFHMAGSQSNITAFLRVRNSHGDVETIIMNDNLLHSTAPYTAYPTYSVEKFGGTGDGGSQDLGGITSAQARSIFAEAYINTLAVDIHMMTAGQVIYKSQLTIFVHTASAPPAGTITLNKGLVQLSSGKISL